MNRRSAFTIVELLVALALIMFIMAILSEAFVAGLTTFRNLKAVADMAERLRSAGAMIRRDLAADHFDGKRRMSQSDFWSDGNGNLRPPRQGFFRFYQGSAVSNNVTAPFHTEGNDPLFPTAGEIVQSRYATDQMLHFTAKLRGNERGDFFSTGKIPAGSALLSTPQFFGSRHYQEAGGTVYNSQWAEVVYFLRAIPGETALGAQLYGLYRRQLLLVPDNGLLSSPISATLKQYPEMSIGAAGTFNNPRDVTMPVNRFGMDPTNLAGVLTTTDPVTGKPSYPTMYDTTGDLNYKETDLLLTDVVSFEVRFLPTTWAQQNGGGPHFVDVHFAQFVPYHANNTANFAGAWIYDTWSDAVETSASPDTTCPTWYANWSTAGSHATMPFTTSLQMAAVQVVIRVWDFKTQQTREVSISQDL